MDVVGGLAVLLIIIGILGLFISTIGSALLAWGVSKFSLSNQSQSFMKDSSFPLSIDVLVAARNEETLICQTLSSLASAKKQFLGNNQFPLGLQPQIRIQVGVDHCTDRTEELALQWAAGNGVDLFVTTNPDQPGKWNMLQHLISQSNADWIALVDVGSVWDPALFTAAKSHLYNTKVLGIAPSYRAIHSSVLESLNWKLERFIKSIEARAGGPVSVHGATVLYRREHLLKALQELKNDFWLNDDVVIPLALRIQSPLLRLVYLSKNDGRAWITDFGVKSETGIEFGRRKRILLGNLQWIRKFYGKAIRTNAVVGITASRRVFRVFWAYWVSFFTAGSALMAVSFFQPSLFYIGAGITGLAVLAKYPFGGGIQRLRSAFWVGLSTPFHWQNTGNATEKIWN